jgi:HD-like signal output (HDOD) protein
MTNIQEMVSGIVHLIPLPRAYLRIREMIHDPAASRVDVVRVISNDPAMTARLLRIANSAFFGLSGKIETISKAVAVMGLNRVHDLALATAAVPVMNELKSELVDMHDFWRRSIYGAVVARRLAERAGLPSPDRLFVAGLLHYAGHLILCHHLPEEMKEAKARACNQGRPLFMVEDEMLGFDYSDVGHELLSVWQLPISLRMMVGAHTRPATAEEYVIETAMLHIACGISHAASAAQDETAPDFEPIAFQIVGVAPGEVETLMQDSDAEVMEAFNLLMPNAARPGHPAGRIVHTAPVAQA